MRQPARSKGFSLALFALIVLVIVAAFVALKISQRGEDVGAAEIETRAKLKRVQNALIAFVAQNQRLPCPADPSSAVGDEAPIGGNATCTFPAGTLPWRTIAASRDDSIDSWGDKISYRVFSGTTGLTQAYGASMVNCDTTNFNIATGLNPPPPALDAGALCGAVHDNLDTQFLAGKGLQVSDFGALPPRTDIAYVLVSHGPTGMGAYTSAGIQKTPPNSADELANINTTTPAGQFVAKASSPPGTDPAAVTFFDDILVFQGITELLAQANLGARDWPEPVLGYTMNNAAVSTALGGAPVAVGDVGVTSVTFGSGANQATVGGFQSGSSTDIAFNTSGGAPSLGIAGTNLLSSDFAQKLHIDFQQSVSKLGIALADFGTSVVAGSTVTEQVQFFFSDGTHTITIVKSACRPDGGVATFSIDPGIAFTSVEISPLAAVPSGVTQFGVADFQVCSSAPGSCVSALATSNTACP